jgi:hypothetical protein
MSGQSLWTEHQVVPVVPALGESMSEISVARPGNEGCSQALAKYVRTIGSFPYEKGIGQGTGPKVCSGYR